MCEMRGWLQGLIDGTCDINEVDELIHKKINDAVKKGYEYGVVDGRIMRSDAQERRTRRDLTPLGTIPLQKINKGSESPFLDKVKAEFDRVATSQEEKGIRKYGHELRPNDNYNWLDMALEELVDAVKYIIAEKAKRGEI